MNITKINLSTANHWNNNPNWATDEEWVRAAANLEAETGVDILIGADLGNKLDFPQSNRCRSISSISSGRFKRFTISRGINNISS